MKFINLYISLVVIISLFGITASFAAPSKYDAPISFNNTEEPAEVNHGNFAPTNLPRTSPPPPLRNMVNNSNNTPSFIPTSPNRFSPPPRLYKNKTSIRENISENSSKNSSFNFPNYSGKSVKELKKIYIKMMEENNFLNALLALMEIRKIRGEIDEILFNMAKCYDFLGKYHEAADLLDGCSNKKIDNNILVEELLWNRLGLFVSTANEEELNEIKKDFIKIVGEYNIQTDSKLNVQPPKNKTKNSFFIVNSLKNLFSGDDKIKSQKITQKKIVKLSDQLTSKLSKIVSAISNRTIFLIPDRNNKYLSDEFLKIKPLIKGKKYKEASILTLNLSRKFQGNFTLFIMMSSLLRKLNNFGQAEKMCEFCFKMRPLDPRTLIELAKIKIAQNQFNVAKELIKKIFSLYPNYEPAISMVTFIDSEETKHFKKSSSFTDNKTSKKKKRKKISGFVYKTDIFCDNSDKVFLKKHSPILNSNSFSSKLLFRTKKKQPVKIIAQIGDWYHIILGNHLRCRLQK